ncbi:MAG: hypothetical protein ACYCZN_09675 [Candidatus Dormibacteria bacterium]
MSKPLVAQDEARIRARACHQAVYDEVRAFFDETQVPAQVRAVFDEALALYQAAK